MSTPGPEPRATVVDVVVVLGVFLVAGAVTGAVWQHVVDPVIVTRNEFGVTTGEVALSNQFDRDGWFAVLGGGCGLVLGLALMAWRRTQEVVTLLTITAGALLAAWVSARVGRWLGPDDPTRLLAEGEVGASAEGAVVVTAEAAYLVWPIAAVLGALLVLWSPPGQRLVTQDDERPVEVEDPGMARSD